MTNATQGAKFVVAGDVFHTPSVSPELMNLVLSWIPDDGIGVAGNHDLPHHSLKELRTCSLHTLELAGKLSLLTERLEGMWEDKRHQVLYQGFNWGERPRANPREFFLTHPSPDWKHVAIVHAYVWMEGHSFPGVPEKTHVQHYTRDLAGFDVAVFGDNHQPFRFDYPSKRILYNHGAAQRRRIDERHLQLGTGLLWDDGEFEVLPYDPPEKWVELPQDAEELAGAGIDAAALLQTILDLAEQHEGFEDAMGRVLAAATVPPPVRRLLTDWLEKARKRIGK